MRLVECAESCLQAGFNSIADASFLDAADRELSHIAGRSNECDVRFHFLPGRSIDSAESGSHASQAAPMRPKPISPSSTLSYVTSSR